MPAESVRLPGGERIRVFDFDREDPEHLIVLKEAVYGKPVDRRVFEWQYFDHPKSRELRVFVVEHERGIIAATTRMPATVRVGGKDRPAFFNIDSMVHPAHRRRGLMRDLYLYARSRLPASSILFSKGSSPQIYPLLLGIGYREIVPSTYLVNYPSPTRWLLSRLRLRPTPSRGIARFDDDVESLRPVEGAPGLEGLDGFERAVRFEPAHDAFFERAGRDFSAIFRRDAAFMNWRYVDVPHRRYAAFARCDGGRITSMLVLSHDAEHVRIVDLVWDPDRADEPARAIRFAQACCHRQHVVRLACFATHPCLREALAACGFHDRGETPRFSALAPPEIAGALYEGGFHAMDGDGDTEFS